MDGYLLKYMFVCLNVCVVVVGGCSTPFPSSIQSYERARTHTRADASMPNAVVIVAFAVCGQCRHRRHLTHTISTIYTWHCNVCVEYLTMEKMLDAQYEWWRNSEALTFLYTHKRLATSDNFPSIRNHPEDSTQFSIMIAKRVCLFCVE